MPTPAQVLEEGDSSQPGVANSHLLLTQSVPQAHPLVVMIFVGLQ